MDDSRIRELLTQGYCCADALCQVGLEQLGQQDELLIKTLRGLCNGLHCGGTCGALTGGACLISLLAPPVARSSMVKMLAHWFTETYSPAYGSINCQDIRPHADCADVVACTYLRAMELLEEYTP